MNDDTIRNRLRHVYWMGGSPCAGKSTMAGLIAAAHGLTHYHIDQELRTRLPKPEPARQPCLAYWVSSTWDELWMRPVDVLLDDVIRCYQEQFDLVIADLLAMDAGAPILVEGNSLLPDSLAPFLFDRRRALWVIPTEAFQRRNYPNRGEWVQYISASERPGSGPQKLDGLRRRLRRLIEGRERPRAGALHGRRGPNHRAERAARDRLFRLFRTLASR